MKTNDKNRTGNIEPSEIMWDPTEFPELAGWEFRILRTELGSTAQEVADSFYQQRLPLTTARSIYRIEERSTIKPRVVAAFRKFVGTDVFDTTLQRLRNTPGWYREQDVFGILQDRREQARYRKRMEERIEKWKERYES
ncbi:hypothetical protein L0152_29925 [bacterium]|nr:hypothetical protein [bacterium]